MVNMLEHVHFLTVPFTCPAPLTSLHEGLLLPQDMCCRRVEQGSFLQLRRHGNSVPTALFDVSLAGDAPEGEIYTFKLKRMSPIFAELDFDLVGVAGVNVDQVYLAQLMDVGRGLVERGVGLVACQKCVHPVLQDYLHKEASAGIGKSVK